MRATETSSHRLTRAAHWGRLALLSGVFAACRVGYQELDADPTGPMTAGDAGKTSSATGGTLADDPDPIAGTSTGGSEATPSGGALADAGQTSASGGGAGATSSSGAPSAGAGPTGSTTCGGDACPVGCEGHEYGGHLYAFCSTPLVRSEAEAVCETLGFELVRIDDANELAWLHGVCFAAVGTNNSSTLWPWLGANDIAVDGEWRWADGTQFWQGTQTGSPVGGLYNNWAQNQPVAKDSCATMQNNATDSFWSAQPCTSPHPYTCESG